MGSGGTPDTGNQDYWSSGGAGISWVAISDMSETDKVFSTKKHVTRKGIESKKLRIFPSGTLLFSMYASLGHVAELGIEATTNQAILGLTPLEEVNRDFLKKWLEALRPSLLFVAGSSTQDNLNAEKVKNLPFLMPSKVEQEAIIRFLHLKTTRIDTLIAKKTRFIELLKEKRQAVITKAVTKGLDDSVQMRDSGEEWIGAIPKHWSSVKFNFVARVTEGLVDPRDPPYRDMVLVAPNHIESGTGRLLAQETAAEQNAESGKYTCKQGAVIYSKIRPALAKVVIAPCDCLCSADMYPMNCSEKASPEWLFYLMLSTPFTAWAVLESDRVAMPKINRESLSGLRVFVPPLEEQRSIVDYVNAQLARIDRLILKTERSIELLKEHRAALITAAVTGKIDVREAA